MDCLKCKTPNPEQSTHCGFCGELFKNKQAWRPPKRLVTRDVLVHLERWIFTGMLVADQEAFYVLVEKSEYRITPLARLGALLLGNLGGLAGGAAMSKTVAGIEGGQNRPASIRFGFREEISHITDSITLETSRLIRCSEYFKIPLAQVQAVCIPEDDVILLRTPDFLIEITGEIDKNVAGGNLRLWGYPFSSLERPHPSRTRALFAVLMALAGAAALLGDYYELSQAHAWVVRRNFLKTFWSLDQNTQMTALGLLWIPCILFLTAWLIKAGYLGKN